MSTLSNMVLGGVQGESISNFATVEHFMDSTTKSFEDVVTVDVSTVKELLAAGHRYLDVRTNEEFKKSHVDNALNVPYMFKTEQGRVKNPDFITQVSSVCQKDDYVIVACNSGGRALKACFDLLNEGYKNVVSIRGGYSAWLDYEFRGDQSSAEQFKTVCKFRRP